MALLAAAETSLIQSHNWKIGFVLSTTSLTTSTTAAATTSTTAATTTLTAPAMMAKRKITSTALITIQQ